MKTFKKFLDHPIAKSAGDALKKAQDAAIKHERKTRIPLRAKHPFGKHSSTELRKKTEKAARDFGKGVAASVVAPIGTVMAGGAAAVHPALAPGGFATGQALNYAATGALTAKALRRKAAADKLKNRTHGGSISSKHPDRKRQSTKYEE